MNIAPTASRSFRTPITGILPSIEGFMSSSIEYRDSRSLPPIVADAKGSWQLMEHILAGINALSGRQDFSSTYGVPARLEFIWNEQTAERGVVIFDGQGNLIVHALNALLGYTGAEPDFSANILTALGVPDEMLKEIQVAALDAIPYVIVVSREKRENINGVETALRTREVEPAWTWWIAR